MAEASQPQPASAPASRGQAFLGKFTVLQGASRELWLVFILKFLNFAAYAVTNSTIVLWLSSQFHFDDKQASYTVMAWSITMTVTTVLVGSFTDAVGLRRTFFLGVWVCIFARAVMVFANVKWLALGFGLFPLAIGEALGTPVLVASVRCFSTTRQRSMSFSVLYAMGNVGSMCAGFLFDSLRRGLGEHGHYSVPLLGANLSTYQSLFLVSLIIEFLMFPFLWLLRDGATVTDEGVKITPRKQRDATLGILASMWLTVRNSARETVRLFAGLIGQSGFYRLLTFLMLIAFLKLIFMQMYYVYPKWGIRELGDGAPVGRLWAINPTIAIFLVPLVGALTQRFSAYAMVTLGGAISAAAVFIMALPAGWFTPLADGAFGNWLGHGYLGLHGAVHPYYVMIAVFIVFMSIGEAFYSPRVYEYTSSIAPKGQEASYGALSYVPFLLAKLLIGAFSGLLLTNYCPEHGPRHSGMLWLAVAITASIAPLGLILLRRYIRVHEAGRED